MFCIKEYCICFITLLLFTSCKEIDRAPRIQISLSEVSVCTHPNGADAIVIQMTDEFYPQNYELFSEDSRKYNTAYAEFLGFKYNIPLHVFENKIKGKEFGEFLKTGRGGASIYYPSCFRVYDESRLESIKKRIEGVYDKTVSTMSYGCGKTHYADSLPNYILGGRNSSTRSASSGKNGFTWYGDSLGINGRHELPELSKRLSRTATGRYFSDIHRGLLSQTEASNYVREQVALTMKNHGFYTNFMHWQDYYPNVKGDTIKGLEVIDSLFIAMRAGIGSYATAKVDYNEAVEYMYVKEAVVSASIVAFESGEVELHVKLEKKYPMDYNGIDTPITISIEKNQLGGLKFRNIELTDRIKNVYANETHVFINAILDFNNIENEIPLKLGVAKDLPNRFEPIHLTFDSEGLVEASKKGKYVLFKRPTHGERYEMSIVDRTEEFALNYRLPSFKKGYDYFCGAITVDGESSLISINKE